jgi:hypothetical protein
MGDCGVEGWWMGDEDGGPSGEWMTTVCCWGAFELRLGGPIRRLGGPTLPGPCCWRCFCCCLLRYSCKQQAYTTQLKNILTQLQCFSTTVVPKRFEYNDSFLTWQISWTSPSPYNNICTFRHC